MQLVTSKQIQTKFGEVADIVKGREPIAITQYGKPTMILIRYDDGMALLREYSAKRFVTRLADQAKTLPEPTEQEIAELTKLIEAEREIYYQEQLSHHVKK